MVTGLERWRQRGPRLAWPPIPVHQSGSQSGPKVAQGAPTHLEPRALSRPGPESLGRDRQGPSGQPHLRPTLWTGGETRPPGGRGCGQGAWQVRAIPGSLCPWPGLSAESPQGPVVSRGPRSPIQDHQEQRPKAGAAGRFSRWGLGLAWSADPGHLRKGASVEHMAPGNTRHVSEAATLVPSWPWCQLMRLCQWVPVAFLPSLSPCPFLPSLSVPFLPRLSEECRARAWALGPLDLPPECLSVSHGP